MNKSAFYKIMVLLVASVLLVGTASAGWFGSDDKKESGTQTPATSGEKEAIPQAKEITLSGTINSHSQLVDDQGKTFELADSKEGGELRGLIGRKVEVTGTVMEEAGQNVVAVHEYKILNE